MKNNKIRKLVIILVIIVSILPILESIKIYRIDENGNLEWIKIQNKPISQHSVSGISITDFFSININKFYILTVPGAIWTTLDDCGDYKKNVNHYCPGDDVYVDGANFNPNTEYNWTITGTPGSCDPNIVIASGTILTNSNGDFCFDAYTVNNNDCGEYKVNVGGKNDNYQVDLTKCNSPPVISNPDPTNGSTGISYCTTSQLCATIQDPEGNLIDWTIQTTPNIGSNSGTGQTNGTKCTPVSGLQPDTTYTWYINATDPLGSGKTTHAIYTFTTKKPNQPPVISNPDPTNGATDIPISISDISVLIEDPEGNNIDWTIQTTPNIGSSSGTGEGNGYKSCAISCLNYGITYTWYVNATDNSECGTTTHAIYTFTTSCNLPPIIFNPVPENGTIGVEHCHYLSVIIEDPEGDLFNWTIETSPNIGFNSCNCDSNGTKICDVYCMKYDTTYTWYVNATDPKSCELTTHAVYTFTTETNGNDPPIISNPNPYTGAIDVPISIKELSVKIEDPEGDCFYWSIETNPDIGSNYGTSYNGTKICEISSLQYDTEYCWIITAIDSFGNLDHRYYTFTTELTPPNIPSTPKGDTVLDIGEIGKYCTETTHPNGNNVQYRFDWNADNYHDYSNWSEFVSSGTEICIDHFWRSWGTYNVRVQARDEFGTLSKWSEGLNVTIVNQPPLAPLINGPKIVKVGDNSYNYTFSSIDTDGTDVSYYIKWGDGQITSWTNFITTDKPYIESHIWNSKGSYIIEAKSKDDHGTESGWSTFKINVPHNKISINNAILNIFKIFLQHLFNKTINILR